MADGTGAASRASKGVGEIGQPPLVYDQKNHGRGNQPKGAYGMSGLIIGGRYEHWSQVPRSQNAWPWQYWTPQEIACKDTGAVLVVPEFLNALDVVRGVIGCPLYLLSAFRSPYHNAVVGGAAQSRHLFGDAGDLIVIGLDKFRLENIARQAGFTGFGYYKTFLHIDLGRKRFWGKEKWYV